MRNAILQFFGGDPLVSWLLTGSLCCIIAAFAVAINSVLERRQRKAHVSVQTQLDRIVAASGARSFRLPAAKGGQWREKRSPLSSRARETGR